MNDPEPPHDYASWIRNYADLVGRVLARGPAAVADELFEHVPDTAAPTSAPGRLRRLLLTNAHLFAHTRDRTEIACTLHGALTREPRVAAWLTGVDEALPPLRLIERGDDAAPIDARLLRVLTGHRAPVNSVAWSPEGNRLATVGAYDASVRIWDTRTWRQEQCLNIRGAALDQGVWSPDGSRLAILGESDRFPDVGEYDADDVGAGRVEHVSMVLVYDTTTWTEIAATPTAPRTGYGDRPVIAWAPDSRILAIGEDIGVRLWAVGGGEQPPWLLVDDKVRRISALHWHPDGALAAVALIEQGPRAISEHRLLTWPRPYADPLYRVWAWSDPYGVRWHPDGERIRLIFQEERVLCGPETERPPSRSEGARTRSRVGAVPAWSSDGQALATLESEHHGWAHLTRWEVGDDSALSKRARIACAPEETTDLAWRPGGDMVATAGESGVRLWSVRGDGHRDRERTGPGFRDPVWSPDGAHVAVRSIREGRWYVAEAHDPRVVEPAGDRCPFPDHDTEEVRELIRAARHEGKDFDVYASMYGFRAPEAVSPGHGLYALAGGLAPVRVFDLLNGGSRRLGDSKPEGRWMLVRFSPDADRLLTVEHRTISHERDGDWVEEIVLTLWDVTTGEQVACARSRGDRRSEEWTDYPRDVVVGRTHLAWCGNHGVIAVHDAHTLEPLSRIRVTEDVNGLAFSPDESALAVTGDAGVRVMDLIDGDGKGARR
ncbi:WD40 repeat domain-containing protein [Nocardiopsis listeri]|uniref:WD40 repeat domain-containing protein n=1 Tax=Nocardiopsis listeri TaxID=53440 RepID=UPI000833887D|nr:WD40 repeat domain-containing protein [Nocardiopsis listeri]